MSRRSSLLGRSDVLRGVPGFCAADTGFGKSQLLDEIAERRASSGVTVSRGHAVMGRRLGRSSGAHVAGLARTGTAAPVSNDAVEFLVQIADRLPLLVDELFVRLVGAGRIRLDAWADTATASGTQGEGLATDVRVRSPEVFSCPIRTATTGWAGDTRWSGRRC